MTRTPPSPERNIICPHDDTPILEFYSGYYDSVYVILHPFIKVIEPDIIDFDTDDYPTKDQFTKYTEKRSWKAFAELSGLNTIHRLDVALRTLILGLKKQFENKSDAQILLSTLEKHNLIAPGEGCFSELLIDDMMKALQNIGHEWIFVGDEFGFERKLEYIQDIIDNTVTPNHDKRNWYTQKNEVLFSTHWDSHFTLLCSNRQTINRILVAYPFEGFFCNENTVTYWSLKTGEENS